MLLRLYFTCLEFSAPEGKLQFYPNVGGRREEEGDDESRFHNNSVVSTEYTRKIKICKNRKRNFLT